MTDLPSAPSTSNVLLAHAGEKNQAEPRARNEVGLGVPCSRGRFGPACGAPPTLGLWGSLGSGPRIALHAAPQPAQHAWHEDGRCIAAALDVRVLRTSPITGRSRELGGVPRVLLRDEVPQQDRCFRVPQAIGTWLWLLSAARLTLLRRPQEHARDKAPRCKAKSTRRNL